MNDACKTFPQEKQGQEREFSADYMEKCVFCKLELTRIQSILIICPWINFEERVCNIDFSLRCNVAVAKHVLFRYVEDLHEMLNKKPDSLFLLFRESSIGERSDDLDSERIFVHVDFLSPCTLSSVPEDVRRLTDLVCLTIGVNDKVTWREVIPLVETIENAIYCAFSCACMVNDDKFTSVLSHCAFFWSRERLLEWEHIKKDYKIIDFSRGRIWLILFVVSCIIEASSSSLSLCSFVSGVLCASCKMSSYSFLARWSSTQFIKSI